MINTYEQKNIIPNFWYITLRLMKNIIPKYSLEQLVFGGSFVNIGISLFSV